MPFLPSKINGKGRRNDFLRLLLPATEGETTRCVDGNCAPLFSSAPGASDAGNIVRDVGETGIANVVPFETVVSVANMVQDVGETGIVNVVPSAPWTPMLPALPVENALFTTRFGDIIAMLWLCCLSTPLIDGSARADS